jgi:hypothetical protein
VFATTYFVTEVPLMLAAVTAYRVTDGVAAADLPQC